MSKTKKDLKTNLYFTVHGAQISVEEIADHLGISASYLYRSCTEGDSGCRFPLDLLLPLMEATHDFSLLEHLNARCGKITVNLAQVSRLKVHDPKAMNQIQNNFSKVLAKVISFLETPDAKKVDEITKELQLHLCNVASLKRTVSEYLQEELPLC